MSFGQGKPCSKQDQVRRAVIFFYGYMESFQSTPEVGRDEHFGDKVPR